MSKPREAEQDGEAGLVGLAFSLLEVETKRGRGDEQKRLREGEMARMKKPNRYRDFSGPLWDDRYADTPEDLGALEQMVREYSQNSFDFDQAWSRPLSSEGLKMDRIYELILDGTIRPN